MCFLYRRIVPISKSWALDDDGFFFSRIQTSFVAWLLLCSLYNGRFQTFPYSLVFPYPSFSFGLLEGSKADSRNHVISSPNTSTFHPSSCNSILRTPQLPLLNPLAWVFPAPPRCASSSLKSHRGRNPETVSQFSPSASPQLLTLLNLNQLAFCTNATSRRR